MLSAPDNISFILGEAVQIVQTASSPFHSEETCVNSEAGVAMRNRTHNVMFDELVFLDCISRPEKRRVCFNVLLLDVSNNSECDLRSRDPALQFNRDFP